MDSAPLPLKPILGGVGGLEVDVVRVVDGDTVVVRVTVVRSIDYPEKEYSPRRGVVVRFVPEAGRPEVGSLDVSIGKTRQMVIGPGTTLRIRMQHIDAPEKKQDYGPQATEALRTVLAVRASGTLPTRLYVYDIDKYGRFVGSLVTHDYGDAGQWMVRNGHAWVFRRYFHKRREANLLRFYIGLEDEARAARRGLWAASAPTAPWAYRKARRMHKGIGCDMCGGAEAIAGSAVDHLQVCSLKCYNRARGVGKQ